MEKEWRSWSNGNGPELARPVRAKMFAFMAQVMETEGVIPLEVVVARSHERPHAALKNGNFFSVVRIRFGAGIRTRSFASWWAWQHVQFRWAVEAFPALADTIAEGAT